MYRKHPMYPKYLSSVQGLAHIGSILTGLIMLAFSVVASIFDYLFLPDKIEMFLNIRLLTIVLTAVCISLLALVPWAKKHSKFFLFPILLIDTMASIWMLTHSGIYLPIYLIRYVQVIFAISFYRISFGIFAIASLLTMTLIWLWMSPQISSNYFYLIAYYLIGTSIISITAAYLVEVYRFRSFIVTQDLIKEKASNNALLKELEKVSKTDELTKIANRRQWQEKISQYWDDKKQFGIALIDIDKFKQVNDQSGHKAGDAALIEIAKTMQKLCTENDLAARLGGDELAILFSEKEFTEIYKICRELNHNVSLIKFKEYPKVSLSISIGIAIKEANDISYSVIMHRADEQLYLAKNNRGSICFIDKHLSSNSQTIEIN